MSVNSGSDATEVGAVLTAAAFCRAPGSCGEAMDSQMMAAERATGSQDMTSPRKERNRLVTGKACMVNGALPPECA